MHALHLSFSFIFSSLSLLAPSVPMDNISYQDVLAHWQVQQQQRSVALLKAEAKLAEQPETLVMGRFIYKNDPAGNKNILRVNYQHAKTLPDRSSEKAGKITHVANEYYETENTAVSDVVKGDHNRMTETVVAQTEDIRVQLRPVRSATLSSALNSTVIRIPLREGDRFKKDDLLLAFECSVEKAELKRAEAALQGAESQAQINRRLKELNSISNLEYSSSESLVAQASADVDIIMQKVNKCQVMAPYDGIVSDVFAKEYEGVKQGDKLIQILDDNDLEIELLVPSTWLSWMRVGLPFQVHVIETDNKHAAKVDRIGAKIDPVSQSLKVIGAIDNKENILKPGMSGHAQFSLPKN